MFTGIKDFSFNVAHDVSAYVSSFSKNSVTENEADINRIGTTSIKSHKNPSNENWFSKLSTVKKIYLSFAAVCLLAAAYLKYKEWAQGQLDEENYNILKPLCDQTQLVKSHCLYSFDFPPEMALSEKKELVSDTVKLGQYGNSLHADLLFDKLKVLNTMERKNLIDPLLNLLEFIETNYSEAFKKNDLENPSPIPFNLRDSFRYLYGVVEKIDIQKRMGVISAIKELSPNFEVLGQLTSLIEGLASIETDSSRKEFVKTISSFKMESPTEMEHVWSYLNSVPQADKNSLVELTSKISNSQNIKDGFKIKIIMESLLKVPSQKRVEVADCVKAKDGWGCRIFAACMRPETLKITA